MLAISACGNDLSDLNALSQQSINDNAPIVEVAAYLSAEQVVTTTPMVSDNEGDAQFTVNLVSNIFAGQVTIQQRGTTAVQQVQLRKGFGGRNGNVIVNLSPDAVDANVWHVPDNFVLGNADVELLLRGGLYVLVTTSIHNTGELRGQLLLGGQELLINPLSSIQVVNFNDANEAISAISYLSVDFVTGEVQGSVHALTEIAPTQVSLHAGLAGLEGDAILQYQPDSADSGVWHIPENTELTTEMLQQLETAQLYVQASNTRYSQGVIRGQLYLPYYLVSVTSLSGLNLLPQVNSPGKGKAFFTVNAFDGVAQGIVRVSDMSPDSVILFRANSPNSTEQGRLLHTLESRDDYWQLPTGTVLENSEFSDIGNNRLLFIVTSATYPLGEIGGRL
ncbi:CHRD domain-containing protein [Kaarinaea lacus]